MPRMLLMPVEEPFERSEHPFPSWVVGVCQVVYSDCKPPGLHSYLLPHSLYIGRIDETSSAWIALRLRDPRIHCFAIVASHEGRHQERGFPDSCCGRFPFQNSPRVSLLRFMFFLYAARCIGALKRIHHLLMYIPFRSRFPRRGCSMIRRAD
ncbi:hypothetical protein P280DRAFT_6054 [Massarina eburnea CBS 473.64]|uniref:Uncharacterized protein n=1 Tax=Massarina eburnea CBS 473.64 TaxID=1395130 RepID=A0A6A6SGV6_9PLEO|nr:hypothetical protein P280DRAFT_6054 [Massarina eburnea CBS 473.64]